ncbi:immune-induced peptides [Drosophila mauritiana]|uniref:Immune-induced peptides n=1 Tax=Drosophila mauritiana TaxID=7226 RepID=A0A6P8JPG6_DROMA|nr:immune-induced peptides [Drosophila mauritiana]
MRSYTLLVCIVSTLLFAVTSAQQNYDGRNGPHEFGTPGNGIYIRGQNEGPYTVPGVGGTFQNSPSSGQHSYTDEHGNTYTHSSTATATNLASAPLGFSLGGVLVLLMSLITI